MTLTPNANDVLTGINSILQMFWTWASLLLVFAIWLGIVLGVKVASTFIRSTRALTDYDGPAGAGGAGADPMDDDDTDGPGNDLFPSLT